VRPNSKTYLGANGEWYGEEQWLPLPPMTGEGSALIGQVGASVVDPLSLLGPSDVVGMAVRTGDRQEEGRIKTNRLFASGLERDAHHEPPPTEAPTTEPVTQEPELPEPTEAPSPEPELSAAPEPETSQPPIIVTDPPPPAPSSGSGNKTLVIVAVLLALLLAAIVGAWMARDMIADFFNAPAEETTTPPETAAPTTTDSEHGLKTLEDVAAYLATDPAADAAKTSADTLLQQGNPDLALLVYKYAQRLGNVDSAMALGRMYDPETWSEKTSPFPAPDAETATYWYEPAAEAGNVEAQRRLGSILTSLYPEGFQHTMGVTWLEKAAKAGDSQAQATLDKLR
jgi:hypothetical protein